jgi:hypothetical protein
MTCTIKIIQDDLSVSPIFLKALEYLLENQDNKNRLSVVNQFEIMQLWQIEFKSTISEDWSYIEFPNSFDQLTFSLKFS